MKRIRGMRAWRDGWRVTARDGTEYQVELNPLTGQWILDEPGGERVFDASGRDGIREVGP